MRYPIIDGFRGFFLLFMMIVHANDWLDTTIGKLNHHYFGWVQDAQGFVFISGLVVGLVYGRILQTRGLAEAWRAVGKRCRTIYLHHAVVVLLLASAALTGLIQAPPLRPFLEHPLMVTGASLGLITATMHMEILPMYLYFMALTPLVLLALERGHLATVVVVSAGAWLMAQMQLPSLAAAAIEDALAIPGLHLSLYFDLFAWQVIYLTGLIFGRLLAKGDLNLGVLRSPAVRTAALAAAVLIFSLGVFNRAVNDQWISGMYSDHILSGNTRQEFGPLYLLAFFLDVFVLTWMLQAGVEDRWRPVRLVSTFVRWLFTRRPLVFLGQHSLTVFAFHLPVVYLISGLFPRPPGEFLGSAVLLLCAASVFAPAWIHSVYQARQRGVADRGAAAAPR